MKFSQMHPKFRMGNLTSLKNPVLNERSWSVPHEALWSCVQPCQSLRQPDSDVPATWSDDFLVCLSAAVQTNKLKHSMISTTHSGLTTLHWHLSTTI